MLLRKADGETAGQIALRAGCPVCMLLRANGLISGAWIEMMDEVRLPDADECEKSAFPCPNDLVKAMIPEKTGYIVQKGDSIESVARTHGLPSRLVIACLQGRRLSEGNALYLPAVSKNMKIRTIQPGDTWDKYENACRLRLLNLHFAPLYPGMKILTEE